MSMRTNQTASPYAAPHTPIASAKRSKAQLSRPLNSPTKETSSSSSSVMHRYQPRAGAITSPALNSLRMEEDDEEEPPIFAPPLNGHAADTDHHYPRHHTAKPIHHASYEGEEAESYVDDNAGAVVPAPEAAEEEEEEEFNPFLFIGTLPNYHSVCIAGKICLPPSRHPGRPTLALDLDETLVHCTVDAVPNPDHIFSVMFNEVSYQVYVRKRPYLQPFLELVSQMFEVVVFTASQQVYADKLLDLIDSEGKYIHHRLFRESCLHVEGNYLKDLHVLGRDLSLTMLVDNSPHAYGYQVDNGIPIESWFDDNEDTELVKLSHFLKRVQHVRDVRPAIREHFKTHRLIDAALEKHRQKMAAAMSHSPAAGHK